MTIKITQVAATIQVSAPYSDTWRMAALQLNGAWNPITSQWEFPLDYEAHVRRKVVEIFGTDGTAPTTTLRVALDAARPSGRRFRIGPVLALNKFYRDSRPQLGDGCIVVEGTLRSQGGSARYPEITWEPGTVLEVPGVPVNLAARLIAQSPDAYSMAPTSEPTSSSLETSLIEALRALDDESRTRVLAAVA